MAPDTRCCHGAPSALAGNPIRVGGNPCAVLGGPESLVLLEAGVFSGTAAGPSMSSRTSAAARIREMAHYIRKVYEDSDAMHRVIDLVFAWNLGCICGIVLTYLLCVL